MKQCGECKNFYPQDNFYKRSGKRRGEYYNWCKSCYSAYVVARWIKIKQDAVAYKGGKCHDCGGVFHYAVFEFHHRHAELKTANWVQVRKWNQKRREEELNKCDLLCANCHRMRHVNEHGSVTQLAE